MQLAPFASHRLILRVRLHPTVPQTWSAIFFVWAGQGTRHVRSAISTGSLKSASAALRPLFTRTTKTELELPPMAPTVRRVELPPLHREIYDALVWRESVRLKRDGRIHGGSRQINLVSHNGRDFAGARSRWRKST